MSNQFKVVKKSAGYSVKSFNTEVQAREFANKCILANHTDDYMVCVYIGGILQEI